MTKQEFEKKIGAEISQKDYSIVEHVYTWHPSISEVEGKEQIAKLYKSFGMPIIKNMMEAANYAETLDRAMTQAQRLHGANIMLYKEYLEIAAEKMNGDFYILPSSIHELLAVPVSTAEIEKLRQMVKEANDNEVAPEEILGYEVYRYNRETGEVEVAA